VGVNVRLYKIKDFLKVTETGELDVERSERLIDEIVTAHAFHADSHILLDLRDTTVKVHKLHDIMSLALRLASHRSMFGHKIANVIPNTEDRLVVARQMKAALISEGFTYNFFTDFESAIEWLSD